ncbi:MAG: site-specific integrase [Campylobacter sp.]|nr:site-specific integrase [Campylobacter sp.]
MKTSFKHYADLYLKFGSNDWKYSTYCKNEGIVKNRLSCFFDYDIKDIKPSIIRLWLNSIVDVGSKSKKHYLNSLSCIFNIALQDEIIDKNPIVYLKKLTYTAPKIEPFTDNEVQAILQESKRYGLNFRLFIYIGFFTGMRTGEILALKNSDIDLENRIISINATRSRFGETLPKTKKSIRKIPILNALYSVLKDRKNTKEYLLETQYGLPYRDCYIFQHNYWLPILKKLNINYRRPYTMRHTYATNMLYRNLITPVELANLLGHSSTKMIYDVYVNYLNRNLNDFDRNISIYS